MSPLVAGVAPFLGGAGELSGEGRNGGGTGGDNAPLTVGKGD